MESNGLPLGASANKTKTHTVQESDRYWYEPDGLFRHYALAPRGLDAWIDLTEQERKEAYLGIVRSLEAKLFGKEDDSK